jgi:threonine dehydrogenase-like Zn-dependent dehydrogenase
VPLSQICLSAPPEVSHNADEVPKPRVVEERDVILKVTGSTVCGSDLHLLHGTVIEMEKGDILGHEFCGVVESMGPGVKGLKEGDRVVASFQIACGEVCTIAYFWSHCKSQLIAIVLLLQEEAIFSM